MMMAKVGTVIEWHCNGSLSATKPRPVVQSFGMTDPGRVRPSNEDHFVIAQLARNLCVEQTSIPQSETQYSRHRAHLFLLADGMAGPPAGEVASAMGVMSVEDCLLNCVKRFFLMDESEEQGVLLEFQSALQKADARICEEAAQHPNLVGMGTTLTMAFVVDWKLFVAHAGDSRCYLFCKDKLHQLTRDHTLVAEMIRQGSLSLSDAEHHPDRSVITNVLGGEDLGVCVETHKLELVPGDVLLLCSDGLTTMLKDAEIADILRKESQPRRACERLVAEANSEGGEDNITVIVSHFGESTR